MKLGLPAQVEVEEMGTLNSFFDFVITTISKDETGKSTFLSGEDHIQESADEWKESGNLGQRTQI